MFKRPCWEDKDSYRAIEIATLQRIAWEFLRRNPDYQRSWAGYADQVRKMALPDADVAKYAELLLSDCVSPEEWAALGDNAKTNALCNRLDVMGHYHALPNDPLQFIATDVHYGSPWGLDRIVNPATNYGSFNVRYKESASVIFMPIANILNASETVPGGLGMRDTKWLSLLVDLSLPLKVIDAQIKKEVRRQREVKARNGTITPINKRDISPKKYAEYLRILDAHASGLSAQDIGKAIEPGRANDGELRQRDKRYSAALTEATRLQSEGYRILPLLEFPSGRREKK